MHRIHSILFLSCLLSLCTLDSRSQATAMAEIYSGYGKTAYNMKDYKSSPFIPIGFRAGIGAYGLQFGPDFWTNAKNQEFSFDDSTGAEMFTETIKDTYLGGMVRGYAGDDPRRIAIVFHIGMGLYLSKKNTVYTDYFIKNYPALPMVENYKFRNTLGYNASFGISIPFSERGFHFTIEGQLNYNPRKIDNIKGRYTTLCILAGISYNFIEIYDPGHYQY
jgi:hypothetical protein